MTNTVKNIDFTHHELLELMAIVRAIKAVATEQRNKAEMRLTAELMRSLLDYQVSADGAVVTLDKMTRFSLWLCAERYINFCSETKQYGEYALAVTIATKLSG